MAYGWSYQGTKSYSSTSVSYNFNLGSQELKVAQFFLAHGVYKTEASFRNVLCRAKFGTF